MAQDARKRARDPEQQLLIKRRLAIAQMVENCRWRGWRVQMMESFAAGRIRMRRGGVSNHGTDDELTINIRYL